MTGTDQVFRFQIKLVNRPTTLLELLLSLEKSKKLLFGSEIYQTWFLSLHWLWTFNLTWLSSCCEMRSSWNKTFSWKLLTIVRFCFAVDFTATLLEVKIAISSCKLALNSYTLFIKWPPDLFKVQIARSYYDLMYFTFESFELYLSKIKGLIFKIAAWSAVRFAPASIWKPTKIYNFKT